MLDGVVADRAQAQGVLDGAMERPEIEGLQKTQDRTYSRLPALPMRASNRRRKVGKALGRFQPTSGAA